MHVSSAVEPTNALDSHQAGIAATKTRGCRFFAPHNPSSTPSRPQRVLGVRDLPRTLRRLRLPAAHRGGQAQDHRQEPPAPSRNGRRGHQGEICHRILQRGVPPSVSLVRDVSVARTRSHTNMSRGSSAVTSMFGTSTVWAMRRSTAQLQMAYACWRSNPRVPR